MLYVSGIKGDKYLVTDTDDDTTELISKRAIIMCDLSILGVSSGNIVPRLTEKELVNNIKVSNNSDFLSLMSPYTSVELLFESRPNGLGMLTKYNIQIRFNETDFSIQDAGSKSYRTITLYDLKSHLDWYFRNYRLRRVVGGN